MNHFLSRSATWLQVYHVRNKMDATGLDMLLDIHGDEELPYNFINGNEVSTKVQSTLALQMSMQGHLASLNHCADVNLACGCGNSTVCYSSRSL